MALLPPDDVRRLTDLCGVLHMFPPLTEQARSLARADGEILVPMADDIWVGTEFVHALRAEASWGPPTAATAASTPSR